MKGIYENSKILNKSIHKNSTIGLQVQNIMSQSQTHKCLFWAQKELFGNNLSTQHYDSITNKCLLWAQK